MTDSSGDRAARLDADLEREFRLRFGPAGDPARVHAPGRVNLIGEHLDYNGLAVLPMAIGPGIAIAFRARHDARVRLFNLDAAHPPIECSLEGAGLETRAGGWGDLVRAACGCFSRRFDRLRGFDAVVGGNLPEAAGLSSSTALVVAVARALIATNAIAIDSLDLIERLARAERTVGAPGGAMDQAVCIAGRPREALSVEFDPLRLTRIPLPARWRFVIAHSLVSADKAGRAEQACRARIRECGEALAALRHAGVRGADTYRSLLAEHDRDALLALSEELPGPVLGGRFRHVITEAHRVRQAESMLRDDDIAGFGALMNESHRSLRDDFEASHAELDRLVGLCLASGALGARLTGAGFGGSVVALCEGSAHALTVRLRRDFYGAGGGEALGRAVMFEE